MKIYCYVRLIFGSFIHFKRVKARALRVKKRGRREEGEGEEEGRKEEDQASSVKIIVDFSSGVIPTKVCELLVLGDPFPHTPSPFYSLRKDWLC